MWVKILISLLPVFFFLAGLLLLDSFKLIKKSMLIGAILWGISAAILSYLTAQVNIHLFSFDAKLYSRITAPIVEELLKAICIIYLLRTNKIGFLVDAAIYGFAIGSGFSFLENIYYLNVLTSNNILLWLIRGVGTAVMHAGCTGIFAILAKNMSDKISDKRFYLIILCVIPPILVHSIFNQFLISPIIMTLLQIIILPILILFVFNLSERSLTSWMELSLETDVELLKMMNSNEISKTNIGRYLNTLQKSFSPLVLSDMLCYLKTYTELAVRAKGILIMRNAGFNITIAPDTKEKFEELNYLNKSIGPTGKIALSPLILQSTQDLWQIYFVKN